MIKRITILSIGFAILFYNCQQDFSQTASSVDLALEDLLRQRALDNTGLDFYKLPESDDYTNIPQDPSNPLNDAKVELGKLLFHETRFSYNAQMTEGLFTYSCASCHFAEAGFQAKAAQGLGEGGMGFENRRVNPNYIVNFIDAQPIRSPTVLNTAYQELMTWAGKFGATSYNIGTEDEWETVSGDLTFNELGFEGLETQAIAALRIHRISMDKDFIKDTPRYKELFETAFPEHNAPYLYSDTIAGLALAAYQRSMLTNEAPFQEWLKGRYNQLTDNQKQGAMIFFDKGECYSCHNGPALNSEAFMALGMKDLFDEPGVVLNPDFDDIEKDKVRRGRGEFTKQTEDDYKFKVPQLYSLSPSPFYGHGSSFKSIREVVEYKNTGVKENSLVPDEVLHEEFHTLNLTGTEVDQLVDFLENGLNDTNLARYKPTGLPSGFCFPHNDIESRIELGCE